MINPVKDKNTNTFIFDHGVYRVIVYQVGNQWVLRAGEFYSGRIAPTAHPDLPSAPLYFKTRKAAYSWAWKILGV